MADHGAAAGRRAAASAATALDPRADGVVARNDPAAIGAMKTIWEAGLRVPEDIAVIGAGDIALGDLLCVPLSTVSWSREEQGRHAAELMLDRLGHGGSPKTGVRRVVIPLGYHRMAGQGLRTTP